MKTIPREALVPILWQEIANRADEDGLGGITACALAIAASKKMTYGSAYRRIEQILKGDYLNRKGETIVQQDVTFEVADNILTGLDRQDAWYRELAEFLPELPDLDVVGGWCKRCRARQVEPAGQRCVDCQTVLTRRGGWRRADLHRFSRRDAEAIHRVHTEGGLSLREISRRMYERLGYSSPNSCLETMRMALRREGLRSRRPGEATAISNRVRGRKRLPGEDKNAYKRRMRREIGYRDTRTGEWRRANECVR